MGCALKYGHGWLTSVGGGGWTKERNIYNIRDLPERGGGEGGSWEVRGAGNSHSRTMSPFSLRRRAVWFCVLSSYLIIARSQTSCRLIRAQLLTHSLQIHCNGSAKPKSRPSLGPVRTLWPYNWRRLWEKLLVRWWVQRLVKAGSSPLWEVIVASLLYHKGRTTRWFTVQRASGTMCVALALTRGQTPTNLMASPIGPRLRKVATARSTSRGLYGETSSGR